MREEKLPTTPTDVREAARGYLKRAFEGAPSEAHLTQAATVLLTCPFAAEDPTNGQPPTFSEVK